MLEERKGYLQLVLYSAIVGTVGVFVKLVDGLDIYSIIFFRGAIATLFIFLLVLARGKIKDLAITHPFKTLAVGIIQGGSILLYFGAIMQTSVTNAVFLLYTAPIFSAIFAKYFLKEKIEKDTIIGILTTIIGVLLILKPGTFSFDSKEVIGNLMGLGSGLLYAGMALTAKPIMKKKPGHYISFWQYFVISLMFVFFLKTGTAEAAIVNWWQIGIIGVFCTGIAFTLFMEGVKKVKAQKIFIITALEPLSGTILALILLKEIPSVLTVVGAGLICYGVYRTTRKLPAT